MTANRLQLIALLGLGAGVWLTWSLWGTEHSFPQIPWFAALTGAPSALDHWLVGIAAVASVCLLAALQFRIAPRLRSGPQLAFSVAALGLVLLDQHRLQPWVLHLLVVLWLLWLSPGERALTMVRVFVISIYVHSAVSRFDRASLEMQWELLAPLLERIGATTRFVSERQRLYAGAVFAVWELATAVLLAIPRTRRIGLWASIAMHGALLLILGPLGRDHHAGVLVWNAVWIAQNLVLFASPTRPPSPPEEVPVSQQDVIGGEGRGEEPKHRPVFYPPSTLIRSSLAAGLVLIVGVAPLLEPWGYWDHWPSWRVYSARPETVTFYVSDSRVAGLPEDVQRFVGPPELLSEWRPLSLDAWSFAELHCPVYPQARFRLAVALAVTRTYYLADEVRVVIGSPPDRWTGTRDMHELRGERAIVDACNGFTINVRPRN